MSKNTKAFMRKVERRLGRCIDLHMRACGHDEPTIMALRYEDKFLEFIRGELEKLEDELMERGQQEAQ